MWSLVFWKAVGERAFKTFCQGAVALLLGDGIGITDVNWLSIVSIAGLAAIVSVLTSIASAGATDGSPSLSTEKLTSRG